MSDSDDIRIHRILTKLAEVKARGATCFGSDKHGFRLEAPEPEAKLRAFEQEHGVELPADYRAFLRHAGGSGAGPYYGIFPLAQWNDFAAWVLDDVPADFIARPSALVPGSNGIGLAAPVDALAAYQGTLSIGTQGCSYATQLIISGPYRGRVAYVDGDGAAPYVSREADFLSWYERWLDELLAGYEMSWFGYGPGGDEATFIETLANATADTVLRCEAAQALCRLPKLSDAGTRAVRSALNDPHPSIRAQACRAVGKFKIREAIGQTADLLTDSHVEVRRACVPVLMDLAPNQHAEAVRNALGVEGDAEVARLSLQALKEAALLTRDELLSIAVASPFDQVRATAIYDLKWRPTDVELVTTLLRDQAVQVRLYAAGGARQIGSSALAPVVREQLAVETDPNVVRAMLKALGAIGDPASTDILVTWTNAPDDFHKLDALEALIEIGDRRALPIAKVMLQEHRQPVRRDSKGMTSVSNLYPISELVSRMLKGASAPIFRKLVG